MIKKTIWIGIICIWMISCNTQKTTETTPTEKEATAKVDSVNAIEDAYHFYVLGDWGRNGQLGQKELATQMNKTAEHLEPEFIISTGDNFYPNGIQSTEDPMWESSFEQVYDGHLLQCPWYVVLGNHDYRGSPESEIAYSNKSRRWNMPDRYYYFDKYTDDSTSIRFVFIDTSPYEKEYYSESKYSNVTKQDSAAQKKWMHEVLGESKADWNIVIGHHPLYSGGKRIHDTQDIQKALEGTLKQYEVDAYFAGHEHDLQHIKPPYTTHHFISGAGSDIRPTGKMEYTKFAEATNGFMAVSINKDSMHVQVIDYQGAPIYRTNLYK